MIPYHIRWMEVGDLPQVHAIDELSFTLPWPANSYRYEILENPASLLWVAETMPEEGERQVVGMIVVWLIVDEAHIATIAVLPEFRRLGIGRALLAVALRESYKKGATSATLEVRAHNLAAQQLYQDFGFDVAGRRQGYYQDNREDALLMTLQDLDLDYFDWLEGDQLLDETGESGEI
ncbi:MAG: ribosomal-protein-alanine N-acetyltransferase [Chloroflexota bacterium]|nr:MAG: ribosomal-protein-alanine N-acetyltransferase [Chloroflexota bacterium]